MEIIRLGIEGAWIVTSPILEDERGHFREWFKHKETLAKSGIDFSVQQANISLSNKGVTRGIHYSLFPGGQSKWITCVTGSILDVIVDLRKTSPTYKKVEYVYLSGGDGNSLIIGPELGHGFISREEGTIVSYLLSSPYSPEFEYEINPMDSELNINWQIEKIEGVRQIFSLKDSKAPTLHSRELEGKLP